MDLLPIGVVSSLVCSLQPFLSLYPCRHDLDVIICVYSLLFLVLSMIMYPYSCAFILPVHIIMTGLVTLCPIHLCMDSLYVGIALHWSAPCSHHFLSPIPAGMTWMSRCYVYSSLFVFTLYLFFIFIFYYDRFGYKLCPIHLCTDPLPIGVASSLVCSLQPFISFISVLA